jgi:threonine/homoserine/homoserine lactone efflux protein
MFDTGQFLTFLSATVALLLLPGPNVMYVVTRAIHQGRLAGLASVLGVATGALFHIAAATLGVSAILMSSALAFNLVKLLGAAYLIYLGVRALLTREDSAEKHAEVQPASLRKIFLQGMIVNVLNPKTALFFFAFLPQFVDSSAGSVPLQMLILGGLFSGLGIFTDGMYALAAGTFGDWLKRSEHFLRIQRYVAGVVYIGLGMTAALSGSEQS